jgi:hypothetical protein
MIYPTGNLSNVIHRMDHRNDNTWSNKWIFYFSILFWATQPFSIVFMFSIYTKKLISMFFGLLFWKTTDFLLSLNQKLLCWVELDFCGIWVMFYQMDFKTWSEHFNSDEWSDNFELLKLRVSQEMFREISSINGLTTDDKISRCEFQYFQILIFN